MYISDFNYYRPKTMEEACRILATSEDGVPLAGGTDLLVEMKQGLRHHQDIISLAEIEELKAITVNGNQLNIGAGVTINELIHSNVLQKNCPVIGEAAALIATEQIRNKATLGGNLCTAASCCDTAPILMALGAIVELVSKSGSRTIPMKDFFINHKRTVLNKGEIVKKVTVPVPTTGTGACYNKFGLREAASIAVASVAAMVKVSDNVCTDACIVMGAVAPTSKISQKASDILINKTLSQLTEASSVIKQAGEIAAEDAEPIDDIRGSAAFRREIIKSLIQQGVIEAVNRAKGGGNNNSK